MSFGSAKVEKMAKRDSGWSQFELAGRTVAVLEPVTRPTAAAVWLHDYDEVPLAGRTATEEALVSQGLLVVCPSGGPCWWLDQPASGFPAGMTPARYVTESLVEWIGARWNIRPPQIGLTGVGMGGQGAVNIAFRHARRFPVVAAVAPDIDFHQWHGRGTSLDRMFPSREAARQQTATLHLHPLNWPRHLLLLCDPTDPIAWEGTERLASKLVSSGVPFECDFETRAGGHTWEYFDRMLLVAAKFLGQHLHEPPETLPLPVHPG